MDNQYEVTGLMPGGPGPHVMGLQALVALMENFYFDEMQVGDSLVIKRVS